MNTNLVGADDNPERLGLIKPEWILGVMLAKCCFFSKYVAEVKELNHTETEKVKVKSYS